MKNKKRFIGAGAFLFGFLTLVPSAYAHDCPRGYEEKDRKYDYACILGKTEKYSTKSVEDACKKHKERLEKKEGIKKKEGEQIVLGVIVVEKPADSSCGRIRNNTRTCEFATYMFYEAEFTKPVTVQTNKGPKIEYRFEADMTRLDTGYGRMNIKWQCKKP